MKRGVPPTLLKARTGLFTPPGKTRCASRKSCSDTALLRPATRSSVMATLRQQFRRALGMVGNDRIRAGSSHAGERFYYDLALVDPALLSSRFHHRVLAADVVREKRQLSPLPHCPHHIEVGQGWFDHQEVGPLRFIQCRFQHRLANVGRIHLVLPSISERGRALRGLSEGTIEGACVLDRVAQDRLLAMV